MFVWLGSKYASVSCLVNQKTAHKQIDRPFKIFRYTWVDMQYQINDSVKFVFSN